MAFPVRLGICGVSIWPKRVLGSNRYVLESRRVFRSPHASPMRAVQRATQSHVLGLETDRIDVLDRIVTHTQIRPGQDRVRGRRRGEVRLQRLARPRAALQVGCRMVGDRSPDSWRQAIFWGSLPGRPMPIPRRQSPMRIFVGSRSVSLNLSGGNAPVRERLYEIANDELAAAQEQMLCLGRKTAKERVASFLISQLRHGANCGDGKAEFDLPMSRSDIADYLGLTIETVSRTFTALRVEGLIDLPSTHRVLIPDIATLRASTEA